MNAETFAKKLRASEATKKLYGTKVRQYLNWLDGRSIDQATAQEFIDHLEEKGLAPNTVATAANALRAYFELQGKPLKLHAPKIRIGDPKYRTMDEIYKLLKAADTPLQKCLVGVLFDTGCRISEVLNLRTEDINWDAGFIRVTRKGGRREDVNIGPQALELLRAWLKARESKSRDVFMGMSYDYARKVLLRVAKRAGVEKFTPHQLRHSRAVQMRLQGAELHDVQLHLGHQSIGTTANIYGRLTPTDLKKRIPQSWDPEEVRE